MGQTQYLVLLHCRFKNKLVISVHVVDITGNILNISRDVGSHTNTKHQDFLVFSFLAEVKTV